MKLLLWLAAILLALLALVGGAQGADLRTLYNAIAQVESGVDDGAVGKAGELGRYQILKPYWIDALEYAPELCGVYEDVRDPRYAEWVMVAYWCRYCPRALETGDWKRLALVHHLGPHPERLPKEAERYWKLVWAAMAAMEASDEQV